MAAIVKLCALLICSVTFVVQSSCRVYDYSDMLLVARCQSKCSSHFQYPARYACLKECEESSWTKPGYCAQDVVTSDPCMKTCDFDSQCSGIEKCCLGACGSICSPADIPENLPELPQIPSNITLHESNNHTMFVVHWQGTQDLSNVLYVMQERHHIGVRFKEEKMGDWSVGFVVEKPRLKKKFVFVPGRWYQVRVAAVNQHGTRGFSPPSQASTLSSPPSPPGMPLNLEFEAVNLVGGKYWVELHWDPPVSQLPLSKYIIFWSAFLEATLNDDYQVITQHEVISADQTHFSIPDLDPSKDYFFIRVQAISVFGTRRLKSEMAQKFFSPANYTDAETLVLPGVSTSKRKKRLGVKKSLSNFRVERMYTQNQKLFAKISWTGLGNTVTDHYTVAWSTNECGNMSRTVFQASTENNWYTIHGLKYNCKYKASVKTHHHRLLYSSSLSFTTQAYPCSKELASAVP